MNKYEVMYILNSELEEEKIQALIEKFDALIKANGELEATAAWGKRRMAYPILDMNEGYYVLSDFSANPDFPAELERVMKITDDVLRFLVIRKEA